MSRRPIARARSPQKSKQAPMTDANPSTPPKATEPTRAQRVLASLIGGAGLDEIGAAEKLTRKRTEKILRDEPRRRWVAPAQEFARLQTARLDRYHGFTRANRAPEQYGEEEARAAYAKDQRRRRTSPVGQAGGMNGIHS